MLKLFRDKNRYFFLSLNKNRYLFLFRDKNRYLYQRQGGGWVFSYPGSSIPDLGQWLGQWVAATLEFQHKEWLLRFETWQKDKKTKRQKDKKTKRLKDKMTKRQKDKKAKLQNDKMKKRPKKSLILWCQGSFALLRCFDKSTQSWRRLVSTVICGIQEKLRDTKIQKYKKHTNAKILRTWVCF